MRISLRALTATAVLAASSLYAAHAQYAGSSATFTLDHHTQVPGETLKPGEYTIRVLDQLSDRMIVRVDSSTTKDHAIFLAVPTTKLVRASTSGAENWDGEIDGRAALRGFTFPSGSQVEFVYPKLQAVQLAKKNKAKVVAIDPESQELPNLAKMSKDDLKIVYLWTLSLTTVGTEKKPNAVLAQRFEPASSMQVGAATSPSPQSAPATEVASMEKPTVWEGPTTNPSRRSAPLKVLPKTDSPESTVLFAGLTSLVVLFAMRIKRFNSQRA